MRDDAGVSDQSNRASSLTLMTFPAFLCAAVLARGSFFCKMSPLTLTVSWPMMISELTKLYRAD